MQVTLYPDCSLISQSTNVCITTFHNIGFVRCMYYILIPMFFCLTGVVIFASIVHHYQKNEMEEERRRADANKEKLAVSATGAIHTRAPPPREQSLRGAPLTPPHPSRVPRTCQVNTFALACKAKMAKARAERAEASAAGAGAGAGVSFTSCTSEQT